MSSSWFVHIQAVVKGVVVDPYIAYRASAVDVDVVAAAITDITDITDGQVAHINRPNKPN